MKKALTIYVTICLICPIFNYQEDKPIQEEIEVEFWCDCGEVKLVTSIRHYNYCEKKEQ